MGGSGDTGERRDSPGWPNIAWRGAGGGCGGLPGLKGDAEGCAAVLDQLSWTTAFPHLHPLAPHLPFPTAASPIPALGAPGGLQEHPRHL